MAAVAGPTCMAGRSVVAPAAARQLGLGEMALQRCCGVYDGTQHPRGRVPPRPGAPPATATLQPPASRGLVPPARPIAAALA